MIGRSHRTRFLYSSLSAALRVIVARRLSLASLLVFALWCFSPSLADAQAYLFSIPEMRMQVFVEPDASVRVEYEIVFENNRQARPIDAVDVGLFHKNYDIGRMTAFLDGRPITRISKSPYVNPGVEVNLGTNAIRPGERGVFRFSAVMPDLVYQDTTRDDYASLRVTPTWFGPQFVRGQTRLEIAVHVPAGVEAEEVLHQDVPFTEKALYQGRIVAYWRVDDARMTGPHMVGVSFPQRGMTRVVRMSKWELLVMWWELATPVRLITGLIIMVLFSIFFLRLTGGTGWSVFLVLLGGGTWLFVALPVAHLVSMPVWPFLFWLMHAGTKAGKKKAQRYLPPIASVEGGGIKRGLTAPEAAVLLELPKGKLVTLVVFGLLKKGVVKMISEDPLTVLVEPKFEGEAPARLAAAAADGVVLHSYEHAFMDAIGKKSLPLSEIRFTEALESLVASTVERLSGFDVAQTKKYYEHIINRAWTEAEGLGEIELREKSVDKNLEWMLMRDDYGDGFGRWERSGYRYYPIWIRSPGRVGGVGSIGRAAGGSAPSFQPSFGDVAKSFAGWTENVSGNLASSIVGGAGSAKGSALDLSSFDKVTVDVFQAMASGSGGGGGGGGCACAGCACACACAGGGR